MMYHRILRALLVFMLFSFNAGAQRTAIYTDADRLYKEGLELFDKRQYVSAQKLFSRYAESRPPALLLADARFHEAACGIELFNRDGEWLMREFIRRHPSSARINDAWFYLATSSFRKRKYDDAIEYYEKSTPVRIRGRGRTASR